MDITMCKAIGLDDSGKPFSCARKDFCYRHTAQPSLMRQSWFVEIPIKFATEQCKYFGPSQNKA